jgi:hypothetical protein
MPKLSLTYDQRRMLCKKYNIIDTAPGLLFSGYITYLQHQLRRILGWYTRNMLTLYRTSISDRVIIGAKSMAPMIKSVGFCFTYDRRIPGRYRI